MRISSLSSLLAALLWVCQAASAAAPPGDEELRFDRIASGDGLSHGVVYSVLQDRIGFLWLGTQGGLNRYDGYGFETFLHDPYDPSTLAEGSISQILEAGDGTLWVATWGGGLDRFDPKTGTATHPGDAAELGDARIQSLYKDGDGILWIGTFSRGLYRHDPETGTFSSLRHDPGDPESLPHDRVWALAEDSGGVLWVGTEDGLAILDRASETFRTLRHDGADPTSLSHDLVRALYADRAGVLWVGTENGLNRHDPESGGFRRYLADPGGPRSPWIGVVNVLFEDGLGRFWVGTNGAGLNLLDRATGTFRRFLHDPQDFYSIADDDVRAIHEDRSGILWIATRGGGLSKLDTKPRKFLHTNHRPRDPGSLASEEVRGFAEDRRNRLWVATENALDRWDAENRRFVHYRSRPGDARSLPPGPILRLHVDRSGVLWVAVFRGGLSRYVSDEEGFVTLRHDPGDPESLPSDLVSLVHEDRSGRFWIGTDRGFSHFDRKRQKVTAHFAPDFDDPASLADSFFWALVEDGDGIIWLATDRGGLNRFDPKTGLFQRFLSDPSDPATLSSNRVYAVHESWPNGRLWVGTGHGLDEYLGDGTFRRYSQADGLPSSTVTNILSDGSGSLWLTTNAGLVRFHPDTATMRAYRVRDGLQGDQFRPRAAFSCYDGSLLFGGDNGYNAFHPERVVDNPHLAPVVLTAVRRFGKPMELATLPPAVREIDLSHRDNFFSFEFAALDFTSPGDNRYRYQLEGFDRDWVDAGQRRFADYTNVSSGDYVFRVQGSNNDGKWNEEGLSVEVRIATPWWRTPWFALLAILVLLTGGWGISELRERRHVRREEELERRLEEGLAELGRSEKRYRQLFERNLAGVVRSRLDGAILDCNNAFARIFGYTSRDQCRREHRLQLGLSQEVHENFLLRLHQDGMVGSYETTERTRDGSDVTLLWNANLAEEGTGLEVVIEGTVIDLSERRAIEERLRQGQKLESLGVLAGGIAHDFNNLLVGILGNAELTRRRLPEGSELVENIDEIEEAAQRAATLSQKMLAYSGKGRFVSSPVDLTRAVEEMTPLVDSSISKRVTIRYELAHDLPPIKGDANQLGQVVVNLVTNGAEATPDGGGTVVVATGVTYCDKSCLAATVFSDEDLPPDEYVFFDVQDDGSGMDRETVERMFDPFFTTRFPGRGLGLPVVLGIVRGHHGAISVSSEPGRGTTIRALFPVADASVLREPEAAARPDEDWQGHGRVLLVDDEAIVRKIAQQMMEILGFDVLTAEDGREGVEVFRRHAEEIVLVLLDLTMPRMSGEQALLEMRRIRPDVRVLIVSGYDEQETLRRFEGQEISGFLQKPYKMSLLREKVRSILESPVAVESAVP